MGRTSKGSSTQGRRESTFMCEPKQIRKENPLVCLLRVGSWRLGVSCVSEGAGNNGRDGWGVWCFLADDDVDAATDRGGQSWLLVSE